MLKDLYPFESILNTCVPGDAGVPLWTSRPTLSKYISPVPPPDWSKNIAGDWPLRWSRAPLVVSQTASLLLEPRLDSKSLVPITTSPSDLILSLSCVPLLKEYPSALNSASAQLPPLLSIDLKTVRLCFGSVILKNAKIPWNIFLLLILMMNSSFCQPH